MGLFFLFLLITYNLSLITPAYAYSTQEILNYCYPNSHYDSSKTSCDASGVQQGASCSENVGGTTTTSPQCGCFGANTSHTYEITTHQTQCNDGNGNISQFQTFECGADQGTQWGDCGNPSKCSYNQDCEVPSGDGPHSGYQSCTGLVQSDNSCKEDSRIDSACGPCIPKQSTQIIPVDANAEYDPQTISQGEPVNVFISATRACVQNVNYSGDNGSTQTMAAPTNVTFNQGSTLVDCKQVQVMTCDSSNPTNDWRKCWAEYQCKAADQVGQFSATFSTDVASCNSTDNYTINPPKDCENGQRTPGISSNGNITDQTLGDDLTNVDLIDKGTLPPELYNQVVSGAQQKDSAAFPPGSTDATDVSDSNVKTGVQEGLNGISESLRCGIAQNALVEAILGSLGVPVPYCPERVDLAQQNTYMIHDEAAMWQQTEIPPEAAPSAAPSDCVLQDVNAHNGDPTKMQGNGKIDQTDSSFETGYTVNLPQFSQSP